MSQAKDIFEIVVVGGGPAGLSAALMLGRCRRAILVCDEQKYRNKSSYAMYGYLSRDGVPPLEFLGTSRQELGKYPNIKLKDLKVTRIKREEKTFQIFLADGAEIYAKKIILATGIRDEIPPLPGIMEFFGKSIFLCPYCDGWEFREKPIAVYGRSYQGLRFALLLAKWTKDIVVCTDGPVEETTKEKRRIEELNIPVIPEPIARLEGHNGQLERIVFKNGEVIVRCGLFFNTPIRPNAELAAQLGCRINPRGEIETDSQGLSSVPGVYIAGDASPDIKLAIVAAAEGTKAGYALNRELLKEEGYIL